MSSVYGPAMRPGPGVLKLLDTQASLSLEGLGAELGVCGRKGGEGGEMGALA